jgi:hypothetical protein
MLMRPGRSGMHDLAANDVTFPVVDYSARSEQREHMASLTCPVCGTESLVTVLSSSPEGGLRQVCKECERRRVWDERRVVRQTARGLAALLIYAGILLAFLTFIVDRISISGHPGFGWRQIAGTEVGILIVIIGFLAWRGFLGIVGLFLLILSLGADVLRLGHAPGLGWRKQTALVLASLLIAGGLWWQRALRKREGSQRWLDSGGRRETGSSSRPPSYL